jgi:hypothetical protein
MMPELTAADTGNTPARDADAFAEDVILAGAAERLTAMLTAPPAGTLYHVADRCGVTVVAVPGTSLTGEEVAALPRFRFARYLDIGFVDRAQACEHGMRTEPPAATAPGDVHVVAAAAATGEILSYAVIEQPPAAPAAGRLRSAGRELFSVERVHGRVSSTGCRSCLTWRWARSGRSRTRSRPAPSCVK